MQILEIVILLILIVYVLFFKQLRNKLDVKINLGILILPMLLHGIIEGLRWQMIPIYIVWLILTSLVLFMKERKVSIWVKIPTLFLTFVMILLGVILGSVLPVFKLAEPTGSYAVGTKDIHFKTEREELITKDPSDKREFMIKVWYPADQKGKVLDEYEDYAGRSGFAMKYGLLPSMMEYANRINTHVYTDVDVSQGPFPVLIFSPGYNSKAYGYYALLSEIASHGYIILNINHTYESTGAEFPDGTQRYFDYEYLSTIENEESWKSLQPMIEAFKTQSYEERHPIVRKAIKEYFVAAIEERWTMDIIDVIDQLEDWNNDSFLSQHMNTDQLAVFGHSRGGGTAGMALINDERIDAAANIDGVQWGNMIDTLYQKPFLYLSSDWPAEKEDLNSHIYINKSTDYFYEAKLKNSGHSSFMDIPLMVALSQLSQAGSIDPKAGHEITNDLVLSFMDKHVKKKDTDLSGFENKYPELEFKIYKGDSIR